MMFIAYFTFDWIVIELIEMWKWSFYDRRLEWRGSKLDFVLKAFYMAEIWFLVHILLFFLFVFSNILIRFKLVGPGTQQLLYYFYEYKKVFSNLHWRNFH